MANVMKFTAHELKKILTHNNRTTEIHSNPDIQQEKSHLNYSIDMQHQGLSPKEYFQKRTSEVYLFGRGSKREKDAIVACSWVITLPKELLGDAAKEKEFFQQAFQFVSDRYSEKNVLNNMIHYDEGGLPHIHILFCPITRLDHEIVHHKTTKTKQVIRLASGRYEYQYRFKFDKNGNKIPLKNYARLSDDFDEKIDCNTVMNRMELQQFHKDFQTYLDQKNIHAKVYTGATNGINFSVQALKEFTKHTGLTLDQVQEIIQDKSLLEEFIQNLNHIEDLKDQNKNQEQTISQLQERDFQNHIDSIQSNLTIEELEEKVEALEKDLSKKEMELTQSKDQLEASQKEAHTKEWANDWGRSSGWGTSQPTQHNIEQEYIIE